MSFEIQIPGKPIAKNRPRFAVRRKGKKGDPSAKSFVTTYFDQETEEGRVMNTMRAAFNHTPLVGPITLEAYFYFAPKKPLKKKDQEELIRGGHGCMSQKDFDNLVKFYQDAGNGLLWHDDRDIVSISGYKAYAPYDFTVLRFGPTRFEPRLVVYGAATDTPISLDLTVPVAGFAADPQLVVPTPTPEAAYQPF